MRKNKSINSIFALLTVILITGIIALFYSSLFITEARAMDKKLDPYKVPWIYYTTISDGKEIGLQRNPVTIVEQANEFYDLYKSNNDKSSKTYFFNNVNWLVNNAVQKENYALLPYNFPLPIYNLKAPWFSAMANGQALQVLIKAHEITGDLKYLSVAKSLLNAFFIEVKDGGITYKDSSNEWWYEEYASNDKNIKISRVLNGMLFAVLGIYDYYKYTNDNDAKLLFDKGVNSIKKEISKYNDNGNSYYDLLGNPAFKYHQIHVDLLKKLYHITGEPILIHYSDLWKNYGSSDVNIKQIKMTSKIDQCSDRIANNDDSLIGNENIDCSTKNNINRDNLLDFDKAIDNNARGLAPSFSPPTIFPETKDLTTLEKIEKLKKQWLDLLS